MLPYFAIGRVAILWFWNRLPAPAWLLALTPSPSLSPCWPIRIPGAPVGSFTIGIPLPYVAWCYREMAVLMPPLRGWEADAELARLDYRVWGVHPTVWLERITTPVLTEYLQIVYTLFVPAVLFIAYLLWRQRALRRVSLLRISHRAGIPGLVRGLSCWCPRAVRASSCAICRPSICEACGSRARCN